MPLSIDFSRRSVMAVVNVTPDSFYEACRTPDAASIEARVRRVVAEGAAIIDIGGYSSRPGADDVAPDEEFRRVAEGLSVVRRVAPHTAVSVDTFRAEVAARSVEAFGPVIINDISAGEADPELMKVAARHDVPYVAMHMRGTPSTMQSLTDYDDIVAEVAECLRERTARLVEAGVRRENIIIDPGFGFAKTAEQNFRLLSGLHRLRREGFPILVGVSRKSMIYKTLGVGPADALNGTAALHWECLRQGASILRVHDVREAAEVVRLYEMYEQNSIKL